MSSLGEALPQEINRCRQVQESMKTMRGMPGVVIEPQIAMIEADIQRGIQASISGDVIEILRAYEALKGWEW